MKDNFKKWFLPHHSQLFENLISQVFLVRGGKYREVKN